MANWSSSNSLQVSLPVVETEEYGLHVGQLISDLINLESAIAARLPGDDLTGYRREMELLSRPHSFVNVRILRHLFKCAGLNLNAVTLDHEVARAATQLGLDADAVREIYDVNAFLDAWKHVSQVDAEPVSAISPLASIPATDSGKPSWNSENCEFQAGESQCTIAERARNLRIVLDAFQAAAWPNRISVPQPHDIENPDWLRDVVRQLNAKQREIRFERDGTGQGVKWKWEAASSQTTTELP